MTIVFYQNRLPVAVTEFEETYLNRFAQCIRYDLGEACREVAGNLLWLEVSFNAAYRK